MARICQLAHVELTYNFLAPLFHRLRDEGHDVVAACNMDAGGRVARHYLGDGYPIHRIRGARALTWRTFTTDLIGMARYLRRERFDVVCVHGPLVSLQARLAARLARVRSVIYHAHGFAFHDGMASPVYRLAYLVERFFGRNLCDAVVTVSEEDADLARRRNFRPDASDIVHTPGVGINVERFRPAATAEDHVDGKACRAELGIPTDAVVVTFIGRLVAEKGLRELVAAFAQVCDPNPDLWLLVVGDIVDSERDTSMREFLDGVGRSATGERIVLAGRRSDIPRVLRASDVFVLPSYREGMPVSLLEAMATGLACVATRIRGCREAIEDGVSGLLVPPRDVPMLGAALRRLARSPEARARLGAAARMRAERKYSVAASLAPQVALYRRLIEGAVADG